MKRILFYARLVTAIAVFGFPFPAAYAGKHGSPKGPAPFGADNVQQADKAAVQAQHIVNTETAAGHQPSKSQLQSVQQTARWAELLHEHCGC